MLGQHVIKRVNVSITSSPSKEPFYIIDKIRIEKKKFIIRKIRVVYSYVWVSLIMYGKKFMQLATRTIKSLCK